MKNKLIYCLFIFFSLVLIVGSGFFEKNWSNIFINIGCSILSASIMAMILEMVGYHREKVRLERIKKFYFEELNEQMDILAGRLVWFDSKLHDLRVDWNMPCENYLTFNFMINFAEESENISFEEIVERLKIIGKKYNLNHLYTFEKEEIKRVQKLFEICASSGELILNIAESIKQNKLYLVEKNIIRHDEVNSLIKDIEISLSSFNLKNINYEVAINFYINAYFLVKRLGNYSNSVEISNRGYFDARELNYSNQLF